MQWRGRKTGGVAAAHIASKKKALQQHVPVSDTAWRSVAKACGINGEEVIGSICNVMMAKSYQSMIIKQRNGGQLAGAGILPQAKWRKHFATAISWPHHHHAKYRKLMNSVMAYENQYQRMARNDDQCQCNIMKKA